LTVEEEIERFSTFGVLLDRIDNSGDTYLSYLKLEEGSCTFFSVYKTYRETKRSKAIMEG